MEDTIKPKCLRSGNITINVITVEIIAYFAFISGLLIPKLYIPATPLSVLKRKAKPSIDITKKTLCAVSGSIHIDII